MSSARKTQRRLHELSKWVVLLGLGMVVAWAGVHTAERAAQSKLDTLVERAARYRQTEYAERYNSHARRSEQRLQDVQQLVETWGDPTLGFILLVSGSVLFLVTPGPAVKRRRVRARKRSRDRARPGQRRARPAGTPSRTPHSAAPRTPTQSLLGRESG